MATSETPEEINIQRNLLICGYCRPSSKITYGIIKIISKYFDIIFHYAFRMISIPLEGFTYFDFNVCGIPMHLEYSKSQFKLCALNDSSKLNHAMIKKYGIGTYSILIEIYLKWSDYIETSEHIFSLLKESSQGIIVNTYWSHGIDVSVYEDDLYKMIITFNPTMIHNK